MAEAGLNLQRHNAERLADICLRQSRELDGFLHSLRQQGDLPDLAEAKKAVARIMAEIYVAALHPIFETHPDLKPPGFP